MDEISSVDLVEFLKVLGLKKSKFLDNGKIIDLYTILNIEPAFHEDGTRMLTPYELIGIPPQFKEDGSERPIIFFLKNKCKKVARNYSGEVTDFFVKTNKVRDSRNTLTNLKREYKRALMLGDDARAQELFNMIESISPKEAAMLLGSFYIYTRFYRRMQQQLLIDLFAHFLLIYIRLHTAGAKNGVIKLNKVYRPYKGFDGKGIAQYERHDELDGVFIDVSRFGIRNLKKIVVKTSDDEQEKAITEGTEKPRMRFGTPPMHHRSNIRPRARVEERTNKKDAISKLLDFLSNESASNWSGQTRQEGKKKDYIKPTSPQFNYKEPEKFEIRKDKVEQSQITPRVNVSQENAAKANAPVSGTYQRPQQNMQPQNTQQQNMRPHPNASTFAAPQASKMAPTNAGVSVTGKSGTNTTSPQVPANEDKTKNQQTTTMQTSKNQKETEKSDAELLRERQEMLNRRYNNYYTSGGSVNMEKTEQKNFEEERARQSEIRKNFLDKIRTLIESQRSL